MIHSLKFINYVYKYPHRFLFLIIKLKYLYDYVHDEFVSTNFLLINIYLHIRNNKKIKNCIYYCIDKIKSDKGISLQDGQGFLDRQVKRKNVHIYKVGSLRCAERPLFEKENLTRDRCERHATQCTHILCVNLFLSLFSTLFFLALSDMRLCALARVR